ncbi:MAG UNVERIFIED_CONTAM: hypothetical protein LVR29_19010 [Microcystis novacekii LVE1205-3]
MEGVEIPSEILLPCELPEGEVLAGWLREKGRKVELTVPQRQSKADLLAMVEKNALYELEKTKRSADQGFTVFAGFSGNSRFTGTTPPHRGL